MIQLDFCLRCPFLYQKNTANSPRIWPLSQRVFPNLLFAAEISHPNTLIIQPTNIHSLSQAVRSVTIVYTTAFQSMCLSIPCRRIYSWRLTWCLTYIRCSNRNEPLHPYTQSTEQNPCHLYQLVHTCSKGAIVPLRKVKIDFWGWFYGLICVSPPPPAIPNSYVEILTPGTSECDCIWKMGPLKR